MDPATDRPRRRCGRAGLLGTVLAGLLAVLLPAAAHAYPDPEISCTLHQQKVVSGQDVRIECHADGPVAWSVTFHGETRRMTGRALDTTFTAPQVTATQVIGLQVTARFADPALGTGEVQRTYDVTVSPRSAAADGPTKVAALPSTGGPRTALLGLGLALVLVGLVAVTRARRRDDVSPDPVVTGAGRRET